ncbi:hypothetical protein FRE64_09970 [Euhalothece natronophila Z-M001]|uniref:Uncharacterized protein n=1 Tax=Euhalothece natronophila Z-M001 TaxID=522448 RepID=A0A5B8NMM2_9CHRO|nr:DUF5818 domain-containing protein [Euhalothece natronophila]QDZ40248.1 hypothetical protein FRE64_09970 [Euhalothece natronophila Z-M001]
MIKVTGKIEKRDVGIGAWALVSDEGKTYELKNPPQALRKPQQRVEVKGNIRSDVMTLTMIGEVLEVDSFQLLE